jgi:hypothetical protein
VSETANPSLIDLLDAVLVALPDDVARRRWGRGLEYFRDQAGRVATPRRSVLVQDIVEFLDDKHGLKKAPGQRPVALELAVLRLEEECMRIFRDDPVAAFTIGTIEGGHAPQGPQVHDFAKKLREMDVAGADFSINVIFKLAGTISKPDWSGVHGGRLHPGRRGMVINVAPPEGALGAELDRFLVEAMEEAVVRTDRSIKRHRLDWSTLPHRTILGSLASARSEPPSNLEPTS